ncbi:hypothetical protein ALT721_800071 [Alteromonas alvinellae]
MNDQAKSLSFDIIANLQSQLNSVAAQNENMGKTLQELAQKLGATEGTKLEDLPKLLDAKLAEKEA